MRTSKTFLGKNLKLIAGLAVGAVGGFLYWKYLGCASGNCNITSVWHNSTVYGAIIGGLIGNSLGSGRDKHC